MSEESPEKKKQSSLVKEQPKGGLKDSKSKDEKSRPDTRKRYTKNDDQKPNFYGRDKMFYRKKECFFKKNKINYIDYKDMELLNKFVSRNGRILPPRFTGTSKNWQRKLAKAIKRARYMALLPYVDKRK